MWVNRDSLTSKKTRVNMFQHGRLLTYFNQVGRLHCLMPGWADATVSFMLSGGYNVTDTISQVRLDSNQQLKILSILDRYDSTLKNLCQSVTKEY